MIGLIELPFASLCVLLSFFSMLKGFLVIVA